MKLYILILFYFLQSITFAQHNFSVIGKWQLVAYNGNNGAKDYTNVIKNGEILTFSADSMVKDSIGNTGKYSLGKDKIGYKLHYTLGNKSFYYRVSNSKNTLELVPVTNTFSFICDEGCSYSYTRRKENE
jgi:hypothetical protein